MMAVLSSLVDSSSMRGTGAAGMDTAGGGAAPAGGGAVSPCTAVAKLTMISWPQRRHFMREPRAVTFSSPI
jgi:hypothetical protein